MPVYVHCNWKWATRQEAAIPSIDDIYFQIRYLVREMEKYIEDEGAYDESSCETGGLKLILRDLGSAVAAELCFVANYWVTDDPPDGRKVSEYRSPLFEEMRNG
jgi:hypothetical protein